MAHFYENGRDDATSWENIGGFNTHLLMEIRNAMMDVRADNPAHAELQVVVSEWIKQHPMFDFPDDEIG
ncbi:MAG: hypothetical protein JSV28_06635 [Deltaproteobacteria bacterium]|jgi:hypothetical protein|nr:MAG: hypothetical protein JSV28_06635 [Deltaproteobacteria bacterium]